MHIGRTGHGIERPHLGHVTQVQYELVLEGHASADEAGISALGNDTDPTFVTAFHYFADLLRRLRSQNSRRPPAVLSHPVGIKLLDLRRGYRDRGKRRKDGIGGQELREVGNVVRSDRVESWFGGGVLPPFGTAKQTVRCRSGVEHERQLFECDVNSMYYNSEVLM
jgi:hypothetical protein